MKKIMTISALICISFVLLVGCGLNTTDAQEKEENYQDYLDRFSGAAHDGATAVKDGVEVVTTPVLSYFNKVYAFIKLWAPMICITVMPIGVLLAIFARKNKGLRKLGIIIAVATPVILIFIIYGVGYLKALYL